MNFLDIVFLILWFYFTVRGVRKGFIKEVFSLAGVIVGFVGAYTYIDYVMGFIGAEGTVLKILVFILLYSLIYFAVYLIGAILSKILKLILLGFIDRILGLVLGFVEGFALTGIIVYLLSLFPIGREWVRASKLGPFITDVLREVGFKIHLYIPEDGALTLHRLFKIL